MTTVPFIPTVEISVRIACTATPSAPFLSPRPTQRPAAIAAASVTRTSSSARFRSGDAGATASCSGTFCSVMRGVYRHHRLPVADRGERRLAPGWQDVSREPDPATRAREGGLPALLPRPGRGDAGGG